jgi:hypothetical protein
LNELLEGYLSLSRRAALYMVAAVIGVDGAEILGIAGADADGVAALGRELALKIFGVHAVGRQPFEPLAGLVGDLENREAWAALESQVREALDGDPRLSAEVAGMLISFWGVC